MDRWFPHFWKRAVFFRKIRFQWPAHHTLIQLNTQLSIQIQPVLKKKKKKPRGKTGFYLGRKNCSKPEKSMIKWPEHIFLFYLKEPIGFTRASWYFGSRWELALVLDLEMKNSDSTFAHRHFLFLHKVYRKCLIIRATFPLLLFGTALVCPFGLVELIKQPFHSLTYTCLADKLCVHPSLSAYWVTIKRKLR